MENGITKNFNIKVTKSVTHTTEQEIADKTKIVSCISDESN